MKRKQISTGIWLVVIGIVAILILAPMGSVLIIGGIPVVTPVAVLVEAIGITMIVTAGTSGWTKKMGFVGAVIGTTLMGIAYVVTGGYQEEDYMGVGASALIFAPLFMALGNIDRQVDGEGIS